ncbi:MAG TPA: response regulator transcription factor [Thermoanaerobaculia bacterium]|jgi:two-component system OmpR family response regulator|nr:response regulator transcription factor [Thermoanaerobaculia bacterium]
MRLLIVEDEERLARHLAAAFLSSGYAVDLAFEGARADYLLQTEQYDAVILDLGLPEIDGVRVLRRCRSAANAVPILVLTARGSWHEKVEAIDSGADDYVVKPFQIEEVMARVRALIRRAAGQLQTELRQGALTLDPRAASVTLNGAPVRLSSHEYRVLSYLMHHRERIVSQAEITEHIYAQDFERDSNTIEVFVARLRRKLGRAAIETVRGLGYRIGTP